MTLSEKAFSVLVVFTLGLAIISYTYIKKYNDEMALRVATQAEVNQNAIAYKDILNQKSDSIQNQAVMIKSLNDTVSKKDREKGYWVAVASTFKIQLDSAKNKGSGVASSGTDSLGEYGQVDFSGKKGIAGFIGWTRYYLKPSGVKPLWNLDLGFDQFPLYSTLYQDVDKIWRIKSYVDAPGIKFTTFNDVDSTLFISYKSEVAKVESKPVPFGIRLKANLAILGKTNNNSTASPFQASNLGLDASAEVYYDYWNITYYPAVNTLSAGVVYDFSIGNVIKKIF
jgi:hypothetical protein